ncbi:gluconolaconase [Geomonas limicola]|uniref:Gluconolaconase n=1 Tax=Geomonas limicola TaxID=2740186 RepID=A0A6V8N8U7_9BACT|nr:L-dopachrome tautomerase-related protein [Geomonas limicola]GFO68197.1 gluconolaconase [Geomonas limicola]
MKATLPRLTALVALAVTLSGCASTPARTPVFSPLTEVARSERQWTGIAMTRDGRLFVNYPRWSDQVPFSVGELQPDGSVLPYPDPEMNRWEPGLDPATHLVCVQSVVVDEWGFLWILDPANPKFQGVVPGGPKLLKVDPGSGRVLQTIRYAAPVIDGNSYLNDVRIDPVRRVAYLTDSGSGALVVTDLVSGVSRRLLASDPSTHSERVTLVIEGRPWRRPDGSLPSVHADGIALDSKGEYLYYQALTGRTLYRIPTSSLRDPQLSAAELSAKVERVGDTGAADGLWFGSDGRLYLSAIEENAVKVFVPGQKPEIVVQSPELDWPDSFAQGPDGSIFVTASQINRGPNPGTPYRIFRFRPNR